MVRKRYAICCTHFAARCISCRVAASTSVSSSYRKPLRTGSKLMVGYAKPTAPMGIQRYSWSVDFSHLFARLEIPYIHLNKVKRLAGTLLPAI